jgi:uncharacterized oligopeptide transporter (OPT) family protein
MKDAEALKEWKPKIPKTHPKVWEPQVLLIGLVMGILGVIIGCELITRVGISTNTSIIGAIIAIGISRIPILALRKFKSVHRQNLVQTIISGATFGGANGILLPIGILWLFGRIDLVIPMLIGSAIGLVISVAVLYKVFDTQAFPASGIWPPGIATSECIIAGDIGGKRAKTLIYGGIAGAAGRLAGIPMDVFGVCWIGNIWALTMFGIGLLVRGYSRIWFNYDLMKIYLPHGIMIGAGIVALVQILGIILKKGKSNAKRMSFAKSSKDLSIGFGGGFVLFLLGGLILALISGIYTEMSIPSLITYVIFAAVAAVICEIIVGLSSMHAGWFPAFATALIFLVLGMLIGFPPLALALLVGYLASTGPAFADMGYDLKAGWILRGKGANPKFERAGRVQQCWAELIGFTAAILFILFFYKNYFLADLFPPVDRVYVSTIEAGTSPEVLKWLGIWAIVGAIIQGIGGPAKQIGILFATGLLIFNPWAGWTAILSILTRIAILKKYGKKAQGPMYILAGGFMAGSAITSFTTGTLKAWVK